MRAHTRRPAGVICVRGALLPVWRLEDRAFRGKLSRADLLLSVVAAAVLLRQGTDEMK